MFFARTHCMTNTLTCASCLCCTYTVNVMIAGKCHWSEWGTGLNTLYFCLLHRNTELVLSVKNTVSVEQCHIGLGALPACRLAHLLRINVHSGRLSSVIKTIYCNTWYAVSARCWWSTLSEKLPGFWRAARCVATQEPPWCMTVEPKRDITFQITWGILDSNQAGGGWAGGGKALPAVA